MKRFDVYGLGNALVDIEYEVDLSDLQALGIEKGKMTLADNEARQTALVRQFASRKARRGGGGSAANTIIAVSQLGGRTYYSCRVASDERGRFYVEDLSRAGVTTNAHSLMTSYGVTGTCLVLVTPDADRTMNTFLGVSADVSPSDVDTAALADSQYLYLEGYLTTSANCLAAALYAKEQAQSAGTRVAVSLSDPNVVTHCRSAIDELLAGGVDLLFANEDEAKALTQTDDLNTAVTRLRGWAGEFVVTLGPQGAVAFDGQAIHAIPAVPTLAVDTVGAGDIFAGAFLYALTRRMPYPQAGSLAATAASRLVACRGPRLTLDAMQAVLRECAAKD